MQKERSENMNQENQENLNSTFFMVDELINNEHNSIQSDNFNVLGGNEEVNNNINNENINLNEDENGFNIIKNYHELQRTPNKFIFENINIFNSLLIMINNISFINEDFLREKSKNIINKCDLNNKYCLSSILYHMNRKMWNYPHELKVSTKELSKKYLDFIECYTKTNCQTMKPNEYCYNTKNLNIIIDFIYNKINQEITKERLKLSKNTNINFTNNNIGNYVKNFYENNRSIISDHFIGFYENKKICNNCRKIAYSINENSFSHFYYISFDLTEINKYLINMNMNNNYLNNNSINLSSCFGFKYPKNLDAYNSYCNCFNTQKNNCNSIFSLPNVLTISLSNNNNYNFNIEDELDLRQYVKIDVNNSIYLLTAILCQNSYNKKFIIYCVNPNDGLWYCYTDNKVIYTKKMDINAEPLVFFYQKRNTICYEYKNIKREKNKIKIKIKCSLYPEINMYFESNKKIKDIIGTIRGIYKLEESKNITLLINARKVKDDEILSNININNNHFLAMIN